MFESNRDFLHLRSSRYNRYLSSSVALFYKHMCVSGREWHSGRRTYLLACGGISHSLPVGVPGGVGGDEVSNVLLLRSLKDKAMLLLCALHQHVQGHHGVELVHCDVVQAGILVASHQLFGLLIDKAKT